MRGTIHQHKDSRGIPIRKGQTIAYNRSGDVIEGTILDASNGGHIKIEPHHDFRRIHGSPPIFKVRHGRSILVLHD